MKFDESFRLLEIIFPFKSTEEGSMGTSKRIGAMVKRSLSWTSQLMAITAVFLLGKVDNAQAISETSGNGREVVDQSVGYVMIGDLDAYESEPWPPKME